MENLEKEVFDAIVDEDLANFKDLLDTIRYKRKRSVNGHQIITHMLTHDQSITLFFSGYANINDTIYKEVSRHDNITEAFRLSMPTDMIAEDRSYFYVLRKV